MVTLRFEKQCGCFKMSDLEKEQSFNSIEEAKEEALRMINHINEEFCLKHEYEISAISEDEVSVKMFLRDEI